MSVSPHEVQELCLGVAPHLVVRHPLHLLRARLLQLQVLGPPAPDTRRAPAPELEHALNIKMYQKLCYSCQYKSIDNEILRHFSQHKEMLLHVTYNLQIVPPVRGGLLGPVLGVHVGQLRPRLHLPPRGHHQAAAGASHADQVGVTAAGEYIIISSVIRLAKN